MKPLYEVKPVKAAYVYFGAAKATIFFALIFFVLSILTIISFVTGLLYAAGVFVFFIIYHTVSYNKTSYTFYKDKILFKTGTILSDSSTELLFTNVTLYRKIVPFVEHLLFKTGDVLIESAGAVGTQVYLSSLERSDEVYQYVEQLMQYNGYQLKKKKLVQEERPAPIGIFLELLGAVRFVLVVGFLFGVGIPIAILFNNPDPALLLPLVGLGFLLFFTVVVGFMFLLYMDQQRRVYRIYDDSVTFAEGFLTKRFATMPAENLSDANVNQTFIERLVAVFDVQVSCQGSDQIIHFKNMANGQIMEQNIDLLINRFRRKNRPAAKKTVSKAQIATKRQAIQTPQVKRDRTFTTTLKMDWARTILPPVLMLIALALIFTLVVPPLIAGLTVEQQLELIAGSGGIMFWVILGLLYSAGSQIVAYFATTFNVKADAVERRYRFFSKSSAEFSNDKITGMVISKTPLDWVFGTCSLIFWSIGSSRHLVFRNIKKNDQLNQAILAKMGFAQTQKKTYTMQSNFTLGRYMANSIGYYIAIVLVLILMWVGWNYSGFLIERDVPYFAESVAAAISIAIVLFFLRFVYNLFYYPRSYLILGKQYIMFRSGIFYVQHQYALLDNVKDILTVKIPFATAGTTRFNIAGQVSQSANNQTTRQYGASSFSIHYIDDISTKNDLMDLILLQKPTEKQIQAFETQTNYQQQPVMEQKPSFANPFTFLLTLSIIVFPFLLFLPFTLTYTLWSVKVQKFVIETHRVYWKYGIFYKKQLSVLHNRIDFINKYQGALNKLYSNGQVMIHTAGSGQVEMRVKDIKQFDEFTKTLEHYYQR